jgi:hypothetical protein
MRLVAILLLIVFIILYSTFEAFIPAMYINPKLIKINALKKLEQEQTYSSDLPETKKKKMIKYYLDILKNDINKTGEFLNDVIDIKANTMENGCVNYSDISAGLFGAFAGKYDPDSIKKDVDSAINKFTEDYTFLINDYYNIPEYLINKSSIIVNTVELQGNSIIDFYLDEVKQGLNQLKPDFTTTKIVIYHPDSIKTMILNQFNKIDFEEFPQKIVEIVQSLDKNQCKSRKLCCI